MKMKMKPVDVSVKNNRSFQHLALLVDRPDFLKECLLLRLNLLLTSQKTKPLGLIEEYSGASPELTEEVKALREKYRYPVKLEQAIRMALLENKVTDKDITFYEPDKYPQTEPLKGYSHPILGVRLEPTIRRDRKWYWFKESGYGYRKIQKITGEPITTIRSAIKSYKEKLIIEI